MFVANDPSGQQGTGTVVEIDSVGGIRKINIDDFGINYIVPPTMQVQSVRGSGFSGSVSIGALCQSAGYYTNNDGRLSTNKVLQDNHFYQNWSYALKSEVVIENYREIIRRLVHPVGIAMFGSVLIKRCAEVDLQNSSTLMSFRVPLIGHYVPYTFQTFDDLSMWFLTGGAAAGYSPTNHDLYIRGQGNGLAVTGNPISNDIPFVEATSGILYENDFPNADPFWIVYPHANKTVSSGYHIAKIWNTQLEDFANANGGWQEWSYRKENREEDIAIWIADLQSTITPTAPLYTEPYDFRYALLEYDETSEFRKITARAFFDMPQGQEFDCRSESIVNPTLPIFKVTYPVSGSIANNLSIANSLTIPSDGPSIVSTIPSENSPSVPLEDSPVVSGQVPLPPTLNVVFRILNEENLAIFNAKNIKIFLDNRLKITTGINTRRVTLPGRVAEGRHTLKLEMYDDQDKIIPGTREIVLFAFTVINNPLTGTPLTEVV